MSSSIALHVAHRHSSEYLMHSLVLLSSQLMHPQHTALLVPKDGSCLAQEIPSTLQKGTTFADLDSGGLNSSVCDSARILLDHADR